MKAEDFDWSQPVSAPQKCTDFDWSQPLSTMEQKAEDFDWSQPLTVGAAGGAQRAEDFDWSQPTTSVKEEVAEVATTGRESKQQAVEAEEAGIEALDIMAQQLKFMACLKIMMEELSTLATGFEVDGGQLRHQLYVWLERCVAALKELCQYGATMAPPVGSSCTHLSIALSSDEKLLRHVYNAVTVSKNYQKLVLFVLLKQGDSTI